MFLACSVLFPDFPLLSSSAEFNLVFFYRGLKVLTLLKSSNFFDTFVANRRGNEPYITTTTLVDGEGRLFVS